MREVSANDPKSVAHEKSPLLDHFTLADVDTDTTDCDSVELEKPSCVTMAPCTPDQTNSETNTYQDDEATKEHAKEEINIDEGSKTPPCPDDVAQEACVVANGSSAVSKVDADGTVDVVESTVAIEEDTVSRVSSIQGDMCRICHCIAEESETLISPCDCRGTMKWVHQRCLQRWVKSRDAKKCELCGFVFNMTSSVKPFRKWKKLDMSSVERRRVLCSVTFHIVAITCVIWSLYVLIDRTTQEIQEGDLNWPFWTKLVVVAIGFTGGLVFMYVQCKTYVKLFKRWKQFNRIIYIQDIELMEVITPTGEDTLEESLENTSESPVIINIPESGTGKAADAISS